MAGDMKIYKPSVSEVVLLAILVLLVGLTRIYYGGGRPPMVVWKGELTFRDTLVNLGEIVNLPRDQLLTQHRSVLYQLEEMELIQSSDPTLDSIRHRRWQGRHKLERKSGRPSAKETESDSSKAPERASPQELGDR